MMLKKLTLFASFILLWNLGFAQQQTIFEEGFEGDAFPTEWKVIDEDADDIKWQHVTFKGQDSYQSAGIGPSAANHKDWLFTPTFTFKQGASVTYNLLSNTNSGLLESAEVYLCTNGQAIDNAHKIAVHYNIPADEWTSNTIDLEHLETPITGLNLGDEICIAFKAISKDKNYLLLDNVKVACTHEDATPFLFSNTWEGTGAVNNTINGGESIKIYNKGVAPLTISSVTDLSSTVFSSSLTNDNISSVSLGFNEFVEVSFTANSSEAGNFTKTFEVVTNNGTVNIDLTANVTAPVASISNYNADFDAGFPAEMTAIDADGSGITWVSSDKKPRSGLGLISARNGNSGPANNDYLVSPKIEVKTVTKLAFWAASEKAWEGHKEKFDIVISKGGNTTAADFTITAAPTTLVPSTSYTRFEYNLSEVEGIEAGDQIYVAVRHISPKNSNRWMYIDDYSIVSEASTQEANIVNATIPGSVFPYTIDLDAKTMNCLVSRDTDLTSVDITFEVSEGANISPEGAQNFANGAVSYTVTSGDGAVVNTYSVSLTPEVPAINSMYETFTNVTIPENWKVIDENNDGKTWKITLVDSQNHTGDDSHAAFLNFIDDGAHRDMLVLPHVEVKEDSKISLWAKTNAPLGESFKICASKTGAFVEDFTISVDQITTENSDWKEYSYKLTTLPGVEAGDEIYIAIRSTQVDGDKLIIDDVKLYEANATPQVLAFTFDGILGNATIDNDAHTITAEASFETDITDLTPAFTVTEGATVTPGNGQNFANGAVTYTVATGEASVEYEVSITKAQNSNNDILAMSVEGQVAIPTVNPLLKTVEAGVSTSTNLAALAPSFTLPEGATIVPGNETTQDFSAGPVSYTVTAQNGDEAVWTVTIAKDVPLEGLFEGFEGGETLPAGWLTIDADGNNKDWNIKENASYEGDWGIGTRRNETGNDDWLVTPKVKVRAGDQLTFMARSTAYSYLESFNVKASKTGTNPEDFTITIAEVIDAPGGYEFYPYEYVLNAIDGIETGDEIYIALQCVSYDKSELHVDNIAVGPAPVNPEIELNIPTFDMVSEVNVADQSEKIFTITNTLAGVLTVSEITGIDGTAFTTDFDPSEVALAKDESYSFRVTFTPTLAGEQDAALTIVSNGGEAVLNLKGYGYKPGLYRETFENEESYKYWTSVDNDGDGNGFFIYENDEAAPDIAHTGKTAILSASAFYPSTILHPDNFLITPKLSVDANDKLVFWAGCTMTGSFEENFSVAVSTTDKEVASFDNYLLSNVKVKAGYHLFEVDLAEFAGQDIYIAFRHHNVTDEAQVKFDNIILPVKYVPTKPDLEVLFKRPKYPIIPVSQEFNEKFYAKVTNYGAELTTPSNLTFEVEGTDFNDSHIITTPMAFEAEQEFISNETFSPEAVGNYTLKISADNPEDEYFGDNSISYDIRVDETLLAKEAATTFENFFTFNTNAGNVGQIFEITNRDRLVGVSLYLVGANAGTTFEVQLREMGTQSGYPGLYPTNVIATTIPYTVSGKFEGWVDLEFANPPAIEPGKFFLNIVEEENEAVPVGVTSDYYTPEEVFISQAVDGWLWHKVDVLNDIKVTLMMRAKLDGFVNVSEVAQASEFSMTPNPANDVLRINTENNAQIMIIDEVGRTVLTESVSEGDNAISVSDLRAGSYVVKVIEANNQSVKKLIIRH